ncbi:MAG: marine proteobacterial sortase target protein [Acidobacteria bacterium]|nr:marine proteobacterial sortase target protein [Acidobacteriota bacterium]
MFSKAATTVRGILILVGVAVLATPLGARERCVDSLGPTLKLSEAEGGGLLLKTGQPGLYVRAPELEADVDITVRGVVARTRVSQRFSNPSDEWVEAVYVFPLPEGCAVDTLRMKIGERIIEGQIKERGEARRIFVKAKKAGKRTALLEQERPNMFTTSVANIGPRDAVQVTIEYQQLLVPEDGRFELRFPTVVGPRYLPGVETERSLEGAGWGAPTTAVPDGDRITPPVVPPGGPVVNPLSLTVELDAGAPLGELISAYHAVQISRGEGSSYVISLDAGTVPADRDFVLRWVPRTGEKPTVAAFSEELNGQTYVVLMAMPPQAGGQAARLPREAVFVIDTSGSMHGTSIGQARNALLFALDRLQPADTFNIVAFNSRSWTLFPEVRPASSSNVEEARRWVRGLRAQGGTEMMGALRLALGDQDDVEDRVRQVVFLTDGCVGNEQQLFSFIRENLGASRLFTVGIGSAPNSHFMERAARFGRGTFTYIGSTNEVEEKMRALFTRLESPVLTGLQVDWGGQEAEMWPARIPDLYLGQPLVLTARLGSPPASVGIRGRAGGEAWHLELPVAAPEKGTGLHRLWARRKIASLMDGLAAGVPREEVRNRVVEVALAHHLVSRFTSLVAVDVTPVRPEGAGLHRGAVPTNLPHGWDYKHVFGKVPQTATPGGLLLLVGLMLLLLAVAVLRFGPGAA